MKGRGNGDTRRRLAIVRRKPPARFAQVDFGMRDKEFMRLRLAAENALYKLYTYRPPAYKGKNDAPDY